MSSLPEVSLGDPVETHQVTPPQVTLHKSPSQGTEMVPAKSAELVPADLVPADLPSTDLAGDRMTGPERAWVLVCHWARQAAQGAQEASARPGGVGHAQPESWVQYRARVKSRAWLPEGYSGGWLEWVPVVFHHTIGPVGFGLGHGIVCLLTRMFCFIVAAVLVAVVVVLWLCFS